MSIRTNTIHPENGDFSNHMLLDNSVSQVQQGPNPITLLMTDAAQNNQYREIPLSLIPYFQRDPSLLILIQNMNPNERAEVLSLSQHFLLNSDFSSTNSVAPKEILSWIFLLIPKIPQGYRKEGVQFIQQFLFRGISNIKFSLDRSAIEKLFQIPAMQNSEEFLEILKVSSQFLTDEDGFDACQIVSAIAKKNKTVRTQDVDRSMAFISELSFSDELSVSQKVTIIEQIRDYPAWQELPFIRPGMNSEVVLDIFEALPKNPNQRQEVIETAVSFIRNFCSFYNFSVDSHSYAAYLEENLNSLIEWLSKEPKERRVDFKHLMPFLDRKSPEYSIDLLQVIGAIEPSERDRIILLASMCTNGLPHGEKSKIIEIIHWLGSERESIVPAAWMKMQYLREPNDSMEKLLLKNFLEVPSKQNSNHFSPNVFRVAHHTAPERGPKISQLLQQMGAHVADPDLGALESSIKINELKDEVQKSLILIRNNRNTNQSMAMQLMQNAPPQSWIHKIAAWADQVVAQSHGIALPGGGDVESEFYLSNSPFREDANYFRTIVEFALLAAADRHGKRVIGTCRGIQIINVYYGGTIKNVSDQEEVWQKVQLTQSSYRGQLLQMLGEDWFLGFSFHHQACNQIAPGFEIAAQCNGIPKLIIGQNGRVIGVQTHPEDTYDDNSSIHSTIIRLYRSFFQ